MLRPSTQWGPSLVNQVRPDSLPDRPISVPSRDGEQDEQVEDVVTIKSHDVSMSVPTSDVPPATLSLHKHDGVAQDQRPASISRASKRSYTSSLSPARRLGRPRLGDLPRDERNPWQDNRKVLSLDQAGAVVVAHNIRRDKLVAVKEIKPASRDGLKSLKLGFHENLTAIYAAFYWQGSLYVLGEYLKNGVSLAQLIDSPGVELKIGNMATICKSILKGIQYLQGELDVVHGGISKRTVLCSQSGQIKIANWADTLLSTRMEDAQQDVISVGNILCDLLCWYPVSAQEQMNAEAFVELCKTTSVDDLLYLNNMAPFLLEAGDCCTLAEFVFVTDILRPHDDIVVFGRTSQPGGSHRL